MLVTVPVRSLDRVGCVSTVCCGAALQCAVCAPRPVYRVLTYRCRPLSAPAVRAAATATALLVVPRVSASTGLRPCDPIVEARIVSLSPPASSVAISSAAAAALFVDRTDDRVSRVEL